MIDKVLNTIDSNSMIKKGDTVIVAVSGGPDSMCLLDILLKLRDTLFIKVVAAHVNHCLRGEEGDKDEEYVKNYCIKNGIDFFSKRIDVNKLSKEGKISCEMAGREGRYAFFNELLKKIKGHKIALAHNANDQAETILMRLIRGTGLEGLEGIKAVRDNIFIRPLINIRRKEIEEYCKINNINARIDKTNLENIYTRNKIRLELIPYIENNFNKDIVGVLNRFSTNVKKDNEYLETVTDESYHEFSVEKQGEILIRKGAFIFHEAILSRIIRKALNNLSGSLYNFERIHIESILSIQKQGTGKKVMITKGIVAYNNYGDILLKKEEGIKENNLHKKYNLIMDKCNKIPETPYNIYLRIVNAHEKVSFNGDKNIKYFDYDKINKDISLRYRKNGDRFSPLGMKGSKKLKDLFIDLKIKREERDNIPLICFGEDIGWIVGYKVSEKFKVDNNTKNIIEIKIDVEE